LKNQLQQHTKGPSRTTTLCSNYRLFIIETPSSIPFEFDSVVQGCGVYVAHILKTETVNKWILVAHSVDNIYDAVGSLNAVLSISEAAGGVPQGIQMTYSWTVAPAKEITVGFPPLLIGGQN
jgi:hypothetical protein